MPIQSPTLDRSYIIDAISELAEILPASPFAPERPLLDMVSTIWRYLNPNMPAPSWFNDVA